MLNFNVVMFQKVFRNSSTNHRRNYMILSLRCFLKRLLHVVRQRQDRLLHGQDQCNQAVFIQGLELGYIKRFRGSFTA